MLLNVYLMLKKLILVFDVTRVLNRAGFTKVVHDSICCSQMLDFRGKDKGRTRKGAGEGEFRGGRGQGKDE